METNFKGKIVLVTGSTRNIGRCIAENFARNGATIIINSRHQEDIFQVIKQFKKKGYRCFGISTNVSKFREVEKMINRIISRYGKIDILVNNAAIWRSNNFENIDGRSWEKTIGINLTGVFNCCKAVFTAMKNQGGGKIINIGSEAVKGGTLMADASYVSSKAGVIGLTRQLAIEGGPHNICINIVSAPLVKDLGKDKSNEKYRQSARKTLGLTPLGRLAEAQDIANAVLFLASPRADFITGQTISVNGGLIFI